MKGHPVYPIFGVKRKNILILGYPFFSNILQTIEDNQSFIRCQLKVHQQKVKMSKIDVTTSVL